MTICGHALRQRSESIGGKRWLQPMALVAILMGNGAVAAQLREDMVGLPGGRYPVGSNANAPDARPEHTVE